MKTDRLPLLILALADIAGLVYAVYGFARAGTFVLTFLMERVSEAAASFSFDDFGLSILFLITPLSSLLLYCLLSVSAYDLARGRTWVRWVVPAQLPLRLLDASPTVPVAETALAERLAAPLPELWQTDAVFALLALAETGKAVWVFYLVRRQK